MVNAIEFNIHHSTLNIHHLGSLMNFLIVNGRVIDPSQDLDAKLDVLIEDGTISRVDKKIKTNVETVDATGLIVTPGFIDLHTHLREPGQEHKETIASGTRAAVAGGYTAVCAMANTVPPNDERAVTEMIVAEAARNGSCRVYPIGAVSKGLKGEALAELADLRTAGCVGVSDDGMPVWNAQLMRRALEYCTMLGIPVIAHEEDANLSDAGVIDLDRLIDLMSCSPARIFSLPGGTLKPGAPGDITLLDLDAAVTFMPP